MTSLGAIKSKIQNLYQTNPNIHISVDLTTPKISLKNEPAVIKGVYSHIFQVEENSGNSPKTHTFQYTDIMIRHIDIPELRRN